MRGCIIRAYPKLISFTRCTRTSTSPLKAPVTLALTATATPHVQDDIIQLLGLTQAERIVTGFNRPNLTLEVFSTPDVKAKLNFLRDFLAQAQGAGIVHTGTRRAMRAGAALQAAGLITDTQLLEGFAAEQIIGFADTYDPHLIILSSHGQSGLSEWGRAASCTKSLSRRAGPLQIARESSI